MTSRRARGTGTPQEHTDILLQVDIKAIMEAIDAQSYGFIDLVPPLSEYVFSTAAEDVAAKALYDSKIKKLTRLDTNFVELAEIAAEHIKRASEYIEEHGTLAAADYKLITSLNDEAAELGDTNRRTITAAFNEVNEALEACEDKTVGEEEKLYNTAQTYLKGTSRIYAAKVARVMLEITKEYGTIIANHERSLAEKNWRETTEHTSYHAHFDA